MTTWRVHSIDWLQRAVRRVGLTVAALVVFTVAVTCVLGSPIILGVFYPSDRDYSAVSEVGQAYGAISAVIAAIALLVVVMSLLVQHRQLRAARIQTLSRTNDELVRLAMNNPAYRQCWGARVSPEDLDEDLFYYCSFVVNGWADAWELRLIDEAQAREYLRHFFDSEVPRLYWERHGGWHRRGRSRDHRARFRNVVTEEFLRAANSGPPSRGREMRLERHDGADVCSPSGLIHEESASRPGHS